MGIGRGMQAGRAVADDGQTRGIPRIAEGLDGAPVAVRRDHLPTAEATVGPLLKDVLSRLDGLLPGGAAYPYSLHKGALRIVADRVACPGQTPDQITRWDGTDMSGRGTVPARSNPTPSVTSFVLYPDTLSGRRSAGCHSRAKRPGQS